ncbi:hypothetical protein KCP70_09885 [Salmonella enterica subsp. enterica]|nr:hypothetical protein KCP70_09885 [Salmonella enterica subsp. enterica]
MFASIPFARLRRVNGVSRMAWNSVGSVPGSGESGISWSTPVTAFSRSDAAQSGRFDIADSIARTGDFVAGGIHIDHETRRRDANQHRASMTVPMPF